MSASELDKLVTLLKLKRGPCIAFAIGDVLQEPRQQRELMDRLTQALGNGTFIYEVQMSASDPSLARQLLDLKEQDAAVAERATFFVYGLEDTFPHSLETLNLQREAFKRIGRPVVIWVTREESLAQIARGAPDFWDWRSKVFDFRQELLTLGVEAVPSRPFSVSLFQDYAQAEVSRFQRLAESYIPVLARPVDVALASLATAEGRAALKARPLMDLIATTPRLIIVGEASTGKTATLRNTTLEQARRVAAGEAEAHIPVYVELRDFGRGQHVEYLLTNTLKTVPMDSDTLRQYLAEGRFLCLFDGLSEAITPYECLDDVFRFMHRYPANRFVLTSRPLPDPQKLNVVVKGKKVPVFVITGLVTPALTAPEDVAAPGKYTVRTERAPGLAVSDDKVQESFLLGDLEHKKMLLRITKRNLQELEDRAAMYGSFEVPLRLLRQVDDLKAEIRELEAEMATLEWQSVETEERHGKMVS